MRQSVQFPMLVKSENLSAGETSSRYTATTKRNGKRFYITSRRISSTSQHRVWRDEPLRDYALPHLRWVPRFEDNGRARSNMSAMPLAGGSDSKNDSDKRLSWKYQQQECPKGFYAIRVTLDDDSEGDEREIVVGKQPPILGAISDGCHRARRCWSDVPNQRRRRRRSRPRSRLTNNACHFDAALSRIHGTYRSQRALTISSTERHDLANVERPPPQLAVRSPATRGPNAAAFWGSCSRTWPGPPDRGSCSSDSSMTILQWAGRVGFICPWKPTDRAMIDAFAGSCHRERVANIATTNRRNRMSERRESWRRKSSVNFECLLSEQEKSGVRRSRHRTIGSRHEPDEAKELENAAKGSRDPSRQGFRQAHGRVRRGSKTSQRTR